MTTNLRRAGPADAAAISDVTRAAYAKWVPIIGREPLPMRADYDKAVAEHLIELWEEEGELLALIEMIPEADHLLIENLAVRPDAQGRGLGDRLLHHAADVARSLGFDELRLYTNELFAGNVAFYTRRGFEETHRASIVPGSITVFLRRRLASG